MMNYAKKIFTPLTILLVLVVMGALILSSESEVLYRMQELSLWLPTKYFFHTSTIYPGGTLTWGAAFMTQFFYYPTLGIGLMVAAWAAICALVCHIFRLKGVWQLVSLLIPMALMAALVQTGYWIYYQKLQGHPWVPTLAVLLSLLLALPYRHIRDVRIRLPYMALVGILGYPLMGAWWALTLALMMLPVKWKMNRFEIITVVLGIVLIIAVPVIMVQQFYGQVEISQVYLAGMPCFRYGDTDCAQYRLPYYALALAFMVCGVGRAQSSISKEKAPSTKLSTINYFIVIALLAVAAYGVNMRWERDTNFRKEVAMNNAIERLDWEGVLRTMISQEMGEVMPPTRVMVMMKNLALFRLGRAGDEMFRYPEGAEQQHAPWTVRMTQVGGKLLYYHYGKEGFCYRWCMEDGVEFGWSVDVMKYMTKTSLITHDWDVAQKYINILSKTIYHKEWAEKYAKYVRHPELMAQDEEMKPIIPMAEFPDRLDGDNTLVEMYLLKTFSGGFGADPGYQEMTLLCSLIMKDIELFWPRFRQYLNMHQKEPGFRVPRYYQEAAYLYSMLEPNRPSDLWPDLTNEEAAKRIPFDESIRNSYQKFMDFNTQCGSMSEEQKKVAFQPQFGDTFYYFYFLRRNQKTN